MEHSKEPDRIEVVLHHEPFELIGGDFPGQAGHFHAAESLPAKSRAPGFHPHALENVRVRRQRAAVVLGAQRAIGVKAVSFPHLHHGARRSGGAQANLSVEILPKIHQVGCRAWLA